MSLADTFASPTAGVLAAGSGQVELLTGVHYLVILNALHFSVLPICTLNAARLLIEEGEDPSYYDAEGSD